MKKFVTLSLVAAAALTVAACGDKGADNSATSIDNTTVLNSEDAPLENFNAEDTALNTGDNVALDDANSSVELNDTAGNTGE
ncbi:hypothetical protein [Sphingomonas endolithica]|jgi:hypothetical protein|uniref:hypothetical protein n=1 Tax=Sphingomonas endolithica TaxID=2972485 RepID=UPI0021AEF260|nr:hypothetical protein [Sphingomonas sp. ZFBP2030]